MNPLRRAYRQIPASWERDRNPPAAPLLDAASVLYRLAVGFRDRAYARGWIGTRRLPCSVISVGNLTVGGTGKTPMTVYLARMIRAMGHGVAVVSRGYGGRRSRTGAVVADEAGVILSAGDSGDEPWMMASALPGIPVVVGRNRYRAGLLAAGRWGPDAVVLDDGFQHRALDRDLDLVLLDGRSPLGNGRLLPRGPLREPPSALGRAHALVFTHTPPGPEILAQARRWLPEAAPVFAARLRPVTYRSSEGRLVPEDPLVFRGLSVFGVSGIARNDGFLHTLESLGCRVVGFASFPDHHPYSVAEWAGLSRCARERGAEKIVVTEKDFARIVLRPDPERRVAVVGVEVDFGNDAHRFRDLVRRCLDRHRSL